MEIGYITQIQQKEELVHNQKLPGWMRKIKIWYEQHFLKIRKRGNQYKIPYETLDKQTCEKVAKQLHKILKKEDINYIVLSGYLSGFSELKIQMDKNDIKIIEGRKVFYYLAEKCIEKIIEASNKKMEQMELTILVNDTKRSNMELIKGIAKRMKRINIVTNHIAQFKRLENEIYKELGMGITITNNKRKSLSKSMIILNIDFPEELLNRFQIYRNAIILNLEDRVHIPLKSFRGVTIQFYEMAENKKYEKMYKKYPTFHKGMLYESLLYQTKRVNHMEEVLKEDQVQIGQLIGNNGVIQESEFKKLLVS